MSNENISSTQGSSDFSNVPPPLPSDAASAPPLPPLPPSTAAEQSAENKTTSFSDAAQAAQNVAQNVASNVAGKVGEWKETAKARSSDFVQSQMTEMDRNPTATILKALAIGFAIGLLIRLLEKSREPRNKTSRDIDVDHRPSADEAKYHLGSVFLPFLWPLYRGARKGAEVSAEKAQELSETAQKKAHELAGKARVTQKDLQKKGRKSLEKSRKSLEESLEKIEDWIEDEVTPVIKKGRKRLKEYFS